MTEQRSVIFALVFLGLFASLVPLAPTILQLNNPAQGAIDPPVRFQTGTLNFSDYHQFGINQSNFIETPFYVYEYFYPVNSTLFNMKIIVDENYTYRGLQLEVIRFYLLGYRTGVLVQWYGENGVALGPYLTREQMNYDFGVSGEPFQYNVSIDVSLGNMTVVFHFDDGVFSDPWDAFVNDSLECLHGIPYVNPEAKVTPVLTPLESFLYSLQSLSAWAIDPRVPILIKILIMTPVGALFGFLLFWVGKTILHG